MIATMPSERTVPTGRPEPERARPALARPGRETVARLYAEHGRAVRAFVAARLRDPVAVEDVVQETFLSVLVRGVPESSATGETSASGPDAVGRWLFAVARNTGLKAMRVASRARGVGAPEPPSVESHADSDSGEPSALAAGDEARGLVREALFGLDVELREAVLLRYEGGLDYRAIATRLEVPVSTVQGRLKRARQALREALEPKLGRPGSPGAGPASLERGSGGEVLS